MCSHFPNTFSRGTVQKFHSTLVCRGTPFENPWCSCSSLLIPSGKEVFSCDRSHVCTASLTLSSLANLHPCKASYTCDDLRS